MTPYDPRAEALDALAAMRFPDVSEPPAEQVEAVEAYLRAAYALGVVVFLAADGSIVRNDPPQWAADTAYRAGRKGRPLVPPA